jgi:hypothetical protein
MADNKVVWDDPNVVWDDEQSNSVGLSPEAKSFLAGEKSNTNPLQDFVNAGARAIGKTALGIGGLVSPTLREKAAAVQEPYTGAGKAGQLVGNIAAQFAPAGLPGKIAKGITNPALRNTVRLGLDAGMSGLVGAGQAGGNIEQGLIDASITAGLGAMGHAAGMVMSRFGRNIQMKSMSPRSIDYKEGFTPEKFDAAAKSLGLKGSLQDSYKQIVDKLSDYRIRRNDLLGSAADPQLVFTPKTQHKQLLGGPSVTERSSNLRTSEITNRPANVYQMGPTDPGNVKQAIVTERYPGNDAFGKWRKESIETKLDEAKDAQLIEVINAEAVRNGTLKRAQEEAQRMGLPIPTKITDVYDVSVKGGVNLQAAIKEAKNELSKDIGRLKHLGLGPKIMERFEELEKQIAASLGPMGTTTVEIAENAKESIGLLGAWAYGAREIDSNATEIAANALYTKVRKAIEDAMPDKGELRALNSAMKDLIPIRNAMIARIPVEERNSIASLADITAMIPVMMSGNAGYAALPMLTRMQKSMRMGNWLNRTAPNVPRTGVNIGRALSAAFPSLQNQ